MVVEQSLQTILIAAGTTAVDRIYPLVLPPDVTLPAIAYTRISSPRLHCLTGFSHYARPRFQFTAWALTYEAAKDLANEIRVALDGYLGTVGGVNIQSSFAENELDMYEPQSGFYGVLVDFFIAHGE